jgi:hypothetical protein
VVYPGWIGPASGRRLREDGAARLPQAAVRAIPARLPLLCLLFRRPWLTMERARQAAASPRRTGSRGRVGRLAAGVPERYADRPRPHSCFCRVACRDLASARWRRLHLACRCGRVAGAPRCHYEVAHERASRASRVGRLLCHREAVTRRRPIRPGRSAASTRLRKSLAAAGLPARTTAFKAIRLAEGPAGSEHRRSATTTRDP